MKTKLIFLMLAFILMPKSILNAQEIQVPILPDNNIKIIDVDLEKKLGLFEEYPEFREARLFKKDEQNYVLEISYLKGGDEVRSKKEMTAAELEQFRTKIKDIIFTKAPSVGRDQSGRAAFLTGTTMLSLGYYGWSVPYMIGAEGGVAGGLYLITSGAGFFVPYLLTKESRITKGMANLSIGAATLGLGHGAILWDLFGLSGEKTDQYGFSTYDSKSLNLFMTVTSLTELLAGYFYAENNNVSEGRANIMVSSSFVGALYGGGLGYLIAGDDPETWTITLPVLLGSAGGAVFGNYLANQQNFAPGDAAVMSNVGLLGGMAGGTLLIFLEPEDGRVAVGTLMASSALGFYLGNNLIRGYDFSTSTSTYISLGTLGGGLVGGGLAAILLNNSDGNTQLKLGSIMATAGAALGFGLTYGSLRDDARIGKGTGSNLNFEINPTGFFAGKINKQMGTSIPFLNLNYKF